MQQEVLTIQVVITGETRVKGAAGEAGMVTFTGTVDCPNFHGVILPGGVDTQRMVNGHLTLSARYMLEGTDADGNACRVFIENNGATDDPAQPMTTTPVILPLVLSSFAWLPRETLPLMVPSFCTLDGPTGIMNSPTVTFPFSVAPCWIVSCVAVEGAMGGVLEPSIRMFAVTVEPLPMVTEGVWGSVPPV